MNTIYSYYTAWLVLALSFSVLPTNHALSEEEAFRHNDSSTWEAFFRNVEKIISEAGTASLGEVDKNLINRREVQLRRKFTNLTRDDIALIEKSEAALERLSWRGYPLTGFRSSSAKAVAELSPIFNAEFVGIDNYKIMPTFVEPDVVLFLTSNSGKKCQIGIDRSTTTLTIVIEDDDLDYLLYGDEFGKDFVTKIFKLGESLHEGYGLRLMSVRNRAEIPDEGKRMVIVAKHGDDETLHFRIFNAAGEKELDKLEAEFPDKATSIGDLKEKLAELWDDQEFLSADERSSITTAVTSIANLTLHE